MNRNQVSPRGSALRFATAASVFAAVAVVGSCSDECSPTQPCVDSRPIVQTEVLPHSTTLLALGDTTRFVAVAWDVDGNVVANIPYVISWRSGNPSVASIDPSTGLATAIGEGTTTISATLPGVKSIRSAVLTIVQVPTHIGIYGQPHGAASNEPLSTQPVLEIRDANGNGVSNDTSTVVTAALFSGGGILSGTKSIAVTHGQAEFTDLAIVGDPGFRTLSFSAGTANDLAPKGPRSDLPKATDPRSTIADSSHSSPGHAGMLDDAVSVAQRVTGVALIPALSDSVNIFPGAAAAATSAIDASSDSITAGADAILTMRVKDVEGNSLASGGLAVVIGPVNAVGRNTISITTDNGDGTYTAVFHAVETGTAIIGATLDGDSLTTQPPAITVTAGALAAVLAASIVEQTAPVGGGVAVLPSVRVVDAFDNAVPGAVVTFTVIEGDGVADPGTATTDLDGIATLDRWTLGSTVADNVLTATVAGLSDSSVTFTSSGMLDGNGGTVTNVTGEVTLIFSRDALDEATRVTVDAVVSSPAAATLAPGTVFDIGPQGTQFNDSVLLRIQYETTLLPPGTPESSLRLHRVEGQEWKLVPGSWVDTESRSVVGPIDHLSVYGAIGVAPGGIIQNWPQDTSAQVASVVTPSVVIVDSEGTPLEDVGVEFTVALGGGSVAQSVVVTDESGIAVTDWTLGSSVRENALTASVPGLEPVMIAATTQAGAPSPTTSSVAVSAPSVVAGGDVTLTATVRDAYDNPIPGLTVVFSHGTGSSTGAISTVADHGDGTYTAAFTGQTAGTPTAIGATIDGTVVVSAAPTVMVTLGAVSLTASTVEVSAPVVAAGDEVTLTLTARDPGGNLLSGLATVAFSHTGGTSTGEIAPVTDFGDGTYGATFTGDDAGTPTMVVATIDGNAVVGTPPTVEVTLGAPSPALSTMQTSAPIVSAGDDLLLTVVARDPGGNLLRGLTDVAFNHLGGRSTGVFSPVTDHGDGTYTATFTGHVAGTPTTITATIDGSAVTSADTLSTVIPGPPSLALSSLEVSETTVSAGEIVTLKLIARDPGGNLLAGLAPVAFSRVGGGSTGDISAVIDQGDGSYTATFTGQAAGTAATIRATIYGSPITSTLPTITVTPGAPSLTLSTVTASAPTVVGGDNVVLTLTARDQGGNLLSGLASVAFRHSGGISSGVISTAADQGNGTYTATFTGQTAGSATQVESTINGESVTSSPATVTVFPGPPSLSHSTIAVSVANVVEDEDAILRLTARDAGGNLLTGLTSVAFSHTGGGSAGDISPATEAGNGIYTATFTGQTVGGTATTIEATVGGQKVNSTALITVTIGTPSFSNSTLTVSAPSVSAGQEATLTLTVRDDAGNLVTGLSTVALGFAGGTSTGDISTVTDQGDGTYTATFVGQTAGTPTTIAATINGNNATSGAPTLSVTPGEPSLTLSTLNISAPNVSAGDDLTLTLTALDPGGNLLSSLTVAFNHTGGTSTGTTSLITDHGNGTYTASFTGEAAGSATTFRATIDGNTVTSLPPTATVTLGAPSPTRSSLEVSAGTVTAGGGVALTLTARDPGGNLLSGLSTVAFNHSGGASTGEISPVTDHGDGTYTATFTARAAGDATTIGATIDDNVATSLTPTITVLVGPPALINSTVSASAASVTTGEEATLSLTVRDAGGNLLTGVSPVTFTSAGGTSTGTISSVTDAGEGVYTATFTGGTSGTATTIGASIGEQMVLATVFMTVTIGTPSLARSSVDISAPMVAAGTDITLTLTVKDEAGNSVGGLTNVAFRQGGGTSIGNISSITDHGDGTYAAAFTGVNDGTATTIEATISGQPVSSTALLTVTPTPVALAVHRRDGGTGATLVSSGIPLAPGALRDDELDQLRILVENAEPAIHVEALAGRHTDGTVRSILVQFQHVVDAGADLRAELRLGQPRQIPDIAGTTPPGNPKAVIQPTDANYLVTTRLLGPLNTTSAIPDTPNQLRDWQATLEAQGEIRFAYDADSPFHHSLQYDRALGWFTHWLRSADIKWYDRAIDWTLGWRDFFAPEYDYQPHNDALHGVALHYLLTGDPESRHAVSTVASNFRNWDPVLGNVDATFTDGRIQARVLLSAVLASQLGLTGWDAQARAYVDAILGTQQGDGSFIFQVNCYGSLNFMTGMALEALIKYYTMVEPDNRIPAAVEQGAAHLWDREWVSGDQAFRYLSVDVCWGSAGNQRTAVDLNGYFPYPFYWVFAQTGDATWRNRGDQILAGQMTGAWWGDPSPGNGAKHYNQQIMTVGAGLYWRQQ